MKTLYTKQTAAILTVCLLIALLAIGKIPFVGEDPPSPGLLAQADDAGANAEGSGFNYDPPAPLPAPHPAPHPAALEAAKPQAPPAPVAAASAPPPSTAPAKRPDRLAETNSLTDLGTNVDVEADYARFKARREGRELPAEAPPLSLPPPVQKSTAREVIVVHADEQKTDTLITSSIKTAQGAPAAGAPVVAPNPQAAQPSPAPPGPSISPSFLPPGSPLTVTITHKKIDYIALGQPVDQVMRELAQSMGERVVAASNVKGAVKKHLHGDFPVLMDQLSQEFGLTWFSDGAVIYVDPVEDQQTKIVKLKNVSAAQLSEAMDSAGLSHMRSHIQIAPGEGAARVTGPESFQKVVETLLASLEPGDEPDVKIIKYGNRVK